MHVCIILVLQEGFFYPCEKQASTRNEPSDAVSDLYPLRVSICQLCSKICNATCGGLKEHFLQRICERYTHSPGVNFSRRKPR